MSPQKPIHTRSILLADCDAFFVQMARQQDPRLESEPLLVVGGRPESRGVVTSASYAARKYGIRAGMPMSQAVRLCPQATVCPVPMDACREKNREIAEVLRRFTPVVEVASIDEFYLDLTGCIERFGEKSLEQIARDIQTTVREETGVVISIGGATQRMVAKMAASKAKPAGVFVVPPGEEGAFLRQFELGDLPGVGPVFESELRTRGLRRIEDALAWDEVALVRWLGAARGRWLYQRIRGIDPTPISHLPDKPKSISQENTFAYDLDDDEVIETELFRMVRDVGVSLRKRRMRAKTVSVHVRDDDFTDRRASRTVPEALEADHTLYQVALPLLRKLRRDREHPIRLLGVGVSNLKDDSAPEQLPLFENERSPHETARTLSALSDQIRSRFGKDLLLPGSLIPPPDEDPHKKRERGS